MQKGGAIFTFIKILILGASIQLTSGPVDIGGNELELEAPEALNVVTTGAHLRINVGNNAKTDRLFEARDDTASKYPEGCVKARMITRDGEVRELTNQGILWSEGEVWLSLSAVEYLSTELEFTKVVLSSCADIRGADITWVNYKI